MGSKHQPQKDMPEGMEEYILVKESGTSSFFAIYSPVIFLP